ncbi:long-chain fatty acid--CoA ligase [Rhabdothermincola salaria]|uniref:long-chain fatty acid--CoA ligase n=1 Tax=Rhabdothermincola salaria TaxID=2903142 RepID=UPI001E34BC1A|nr:long-chain fatty acid--CoA ligase [Rhabdothermincola salaria]MCD9624904.1 long-chain fatty acid--CoA ligase [Rhabdothermincola salaria]
MLGLMQDRPLVLTHFFDRAEKLFRDKEVVTATATGIDRVSYGQWAERTRRLGGVLDDLGISADGRVGTFAWNTARHLELYFGVPCSGRVVHTLNIRLFPEQVTYIVNHAEDEVIFVDRSLLGLLWPLVDTFTTVRHLVVMDDGVGELPADTKGVSLHDYEDLLGAASPAEFHVDDENQAASMCYTSGTTGNPKGVVYSHRSTWLHTAGVMMADSLGACERDTIMPVVPMFHANAWGLAHAGVASGADLVMPGPDLSPAALVRLIETQRVTVAAGVPTIWMGVLDAVDGHDVSSLRAIPCGGSAVPKVLSEAYRAKLGMPILQAWGMTETSPVASICRIKSTLDHLTEDAKADLRASIGLIAPGVDFRVVDQATGEAVPWDGVSRGELQVAGPWIAREYYDDDRSGDSFTDDGWLRTGDVVTCDTEGYLRIVDRTKDVVKSGGEWISSVELENEIMGHPSVAEAAVIGVRHPKWGERPLACVVVKPDESVTKDELLGFLDGKVAKWWLPDDVVFIDEVPKTSVGKFSKRDLRDRFADHELPTS